ncbi:MAG: hypothetical protein P8X42_06525 [Calditrichaceae bacterium]
MKNNYFTDIHNHIVFSVDDGAESLDNALLMVEQALECRIRHLAATPHITDLTDEAIVAGIQANFAELNEAVQKRELPVHLYLAAELIYNDQIYKWIKQDWVSLSRDGTYFLFELPLFDLPNGVGEFIFQTKLKGIQPILAHPERYIYLHGQMDKLIRWRQQGCLMQMNAGSLTGQFGGEVLSFSKKLLEADFYSFVASDAHDLSSRNFKVLPKAYEIAYELTSAEKADELFTINPQKALKGESISQQLLNEQLMEKSWFRGIINSIKNFRIN